MLQTPLLVIKSLSKTDSHFLSVMCSLFPKANFQIIYFRSPLCPLLCLFSKCTCLPLSCFTDVVEDRTYICNFEPHRN